VARVEAAAAIVRGVATLAEAQREAVRRIEARAAEVAALSGNQASAAQQMAMSTSAQAHVIAEAAAELAALRNVATVALESVNRFQI